jgi:hypothetical protein
MTEIKYASFKDYYPIYLTEHRQTTNRILHFIGTFLTILCLVTAILFHNMWFILLIPFTGYAFGWIGHYFSEKNKNSAFKYPFLNFACDFLFFGDLISGKQTFSLEHKEERK